MKLAIHTVFILKENILFLEEWIDYHMALGFNRFYLYDNSKVEIPGCSKRTPDEKRHLVNGKQINKYGTNYNKIVNMTNAEMNNFVKRLLDKYKCIKIIDWSPRDRNNKITYEQVKAHNHCLRLLKKDGIDWCASIDMDEYIVIRNYDNIETYLRLLSNQASTRQRRTLANVALGQIRFDSRFNNLGKAVTSIEKSELRLHPRGSSNKNIFRVKATYSINVHGWKGLGRGTVTYKPAVTEICFNHYKLDHRRYRRIRNINPNTMKRAHSRQSYLKIK